MLHLIEGLVKSNTVNFSGGRGGLIFRWTSLDLDAFLDRFDTPIAVTRFRRVEVFDGVMDRVHVKILGG